MYILFVQIKSGAQKASMVVAAMAVAAKAIPLTADYQSVIIVTVAKFPLASTSRIALLLSLPPNLLLLEVDYEYFG